MKRFPPDMLTLIVNGELYGPQPLGAKVLTVCGTSIAHIGDVDVAALDRSHVPYEVIDASNCIVAPGIIDPHEHLIGGSGEEGFNSQTPEITLREIVSAGITTVVGCLGSDTTTRTMEGLLAKAKGLRQDGVTTYLWSGGYDVPPVTLTGSLRRDMLLIEEVIGAGEVAISDKRSSAPSTAELARIVKASYVGGTLTGKGGVTHFHVGEEPSRLAPLRELLDDYHAQPEWLYPTHINRTSELIREAAELTNLGVTVDMDTVDLDAAKWLPCFLDAGGNPERLTFSSDAAVNSPASLWSELRNCIQQQIIDLPRALSFVTINTARVLRLPLKGRIEVGCDADLLIMDKQSMQIRDVIALGTPLLRAGELQKEEKSMASSNRTIQLYGAKTE
ncbi:MAG TPA: amidohydrolase family protein [Bryobacteraceae bacterium]|nr:amidohydrolase family protein [Bryobacteraceae bacterium]